MQMSDKSIECSLVNLEVSDLSKQNLIELPMVYSTPSLPVSTDTVEMQENVNCWLHLKGIEMKSIESEMLQLKEFKESSEKEKMAVLLQHKQFLDGY